MKNSVMPSFSENTYTNPLPVKNRGSLSDEACNINGDPFIMKYNGEYYCYSTGDDGVRVMHSTDLVHFDHLGICLTEKGSFSFWAPCVIYDNGTFYMYYSSNPDGDTDDHAHYLKLAVSTSPTGPFEFRKQFFNVFSIDAHAVRGDNGHMYLFYSVNDYSGTDRNRAGTTIVMDELIDPYTLAGKPVPVVMPSIPEEVFAKNRFGDGRDWYTIEGALYFAKHDSAYVMFSANAFTSPTYFLGYARAPRTADLRDCAWTKYPDDITYDPLVCQNGRVGGTGHNSIAKAPNNVDDWIAYHGFTKRADSSEQYRERSLRIDQVFYGDGRLYTVAPSYEKQDAPAQPVYRNLFNVGSAGMVDIAGKWNVRESCLCQDERCAIAAAYADCAPMENYLYTVSVKWERFHFGGRYGVMAAYVDKRNQVQVLFNEGEKRIEMQSVVNGCCTRTLSAPLPDGFDFEVFHELTVERTGAHFTAYVDDVKMLSGDYALAASRVGMITFYTAAHYDSAELTGCMLLTGENGDGFAAQLESESDSLERNWQVEGGRVMCSAADSNRALFAECGDKYRFSADVRMKTHDPETRAGVYAAFADEDNYLRVTLDAGCRHAYITACADGISATEEVALEDNKGTLITTKRDGTSITVLAGTQILFCGAAPAAATRCGFYADIRTEFSAVEWVRL